MNSANKKQICDFIKKSSNPLILIPENFDIDAVSGALGLYLFFERIKKKPKIACSLDIPEKFLFFADKKTIENSIQGECLYKISFDIGGSRIKELSYEQEKNILKINLAAAGSEFSLGKPRIDLLKFNYDLVFTIGCPDLGSLGKIYHDNVCFFSEMAVINIDSSAENKKFGDINLIQPDTPVSELISEIVNMFSRDALDSRIADLFLAGIIAKTNNFQSTKIKAGTFASASILLRSGANREEIIKRLIGINLLAAEKTEFYPPSKITKQIIDKINKESSWYLRQEKEKIKNLDGLKFLSLNQRVFYLAAILGVIPSLVLLERANPVAVMSPVFEKNLSALPEEKLTGIDEKKLLDYAPIFFKKTENIFSPSDKPKQEFAQSEKNSGVAGPQDKIITTSLEIVREDNLAESAAHADKKTILGGKAEEIGLPRKLSAPLLGINADIQEVGLASGGEMGAPDNYKSAGWFNLGARPGEKGNAVIAGHLDTNLGKGGVFWSLNKIKPGDYIYVTDEYGKKMRFRAVRSEIYDAKNAPMEEIFGSSDKARLNLITCGGAWDWGKKSYDKRLVVFTDYDPE